jgi:hypothetical protein
MSLQSILEIAIGLIFAWLILSFVSMYIQEWVVTRLRWRSGMLEEFIRNMLADPAIAEQFYEHPLIQGLHSGHMGDHRPSYIPSQQFALALFDILMSAGTEASLLQQEIYNLRSDIATLQKDEKKRAQAQYNLALMAARKALNAEGSQVALAHALEGVKTELAILAEINPALQKAVEMALDNVKINKAEVDDILASIQQQTGGESKNPTLAQIRLGVAAISVSQPQLKQALSSLLNGVEEYVSQGESVLARARQNLEQWFDDGMARLSGWYKRRSQKLAFMIGILVAIALNADTLQLAQTLWREPLMRQSLAAQADAFAKQNPDGIPIPTAQQLSEMQIQFAEINIPVGWIGTPLPTDADGAVSMADTTYKLCTLTPKSTVELYGLRVANQCYPIVNAPQLKDLTGWLLKLVGLLASGIAAAQGAPFWFDILKKIINVRTSGSNPADPKSQKAAG